MSETPNPQLPATTSSPVKASDGEIVRLTMDTDQGFAALQRAGNLLSHSTLVPETYRRWQVQKDGTEIENKSGLPNCVVALNMASRMGADPLMVMQNLHIIEGKPSWSSPYVIASINQCGRFSPIRFDLSEPGEEVEVEYSYVVWEDGPNGKRRPVDKTGKLKMRHQTCRAWVIEKATGERLDGPLVSMQMALDEGWLQKKGSKWRTMPEVMLRYRSASLFGRIYAPELLMGLQSREEVEDVIEGEVLPPAPRVVSDAYPKSDRVPDAGNGWEFQTLDRFEGMLEQASKNFKDAGFEKAFGSFEAKWRKRRTEEGPAVVLAELEKALAEMAAPPPPEPEKAAAPSHTTQTAADHKAQAKPGKAEPQQGLPLEGGAQ